MSTQQDVRRIALSLPGTTESDTDFAFAVSNKGKQKGFVWLWKERIDPKKPRVPNPEVIALRVANEDEKHMLIASNGDVYFTEPHYNGYPAVLVRLAIIDSDELAELVTDAWRCLASPAQISEMEAR